MKKVYKDRLTKLAKFLMKLPKQKFDFSLLRTVNCKTTACALGWCPSVFKEWEVCKKPYETDMNDDGKITLKYFSTRLRGSKSNEPEESFDSAIEFFGISFEESRWLFDPYKQEDTPVRTLDEKSTPKQVAKNILAFIKWKEGQE